MLGTSFGEALEAYVAALEEGTWAYDPEANDAVPMDVARPGNLAYEFAKWRVEG